MKFSWREFFRSIIISFLIAVIVIIVIIVYANIADLKIDFLNINPSDEMYRKSIVFDYPPTGPSGPMITYGANGTWLTGPSFTIEIFLEYSGNLAEGLPVELMVIGSLYPPGAQTIASVDVGFVGSLYYSAEGPALSNVPPIIRVNLQNTSTYGLIIPSDVMPSKTITWDVQGDYSPFITIISRNGSKPNTVIYQDYKIHVSPFVVVQQEKYSRINTTLSTALFIFAVVESLALIVRFLPKTWLVNPSNEDNKLSQPKPKKSEPYYKIHRKSKTKKKQGKKRKKR